MTLTLYKPDDVRTVATLYAHLRRGSEIAPGMKEQLKNEFSELAKKYYIPSLFGGGLDACHSDKELAKKVVTKVLIKGEMNEAINKALEHRQNSEDLLNKKMVESLLDFINPGKSGEERDNALQQFFKQFISALEKLNLNQAESIGDRYNNVCFFCGQVGTLRGAHLAEAYVTTTDGIRDANDPLFTRLGGLGTFLAELFGDRIAQPIFRYCSSLLATQVIAKNAMRDVMVMAPNGLVTDSIYWFDELPVIIEQLDQDKVDNIYYYIGNTFPDFIQVDEEGGGFGQDGRYSIKATAGDEIKSNPLKAWKDLCMVGTQQKPVPDDIPVCWYDPKSKNNYCYGTYGNLTTILPNIEPGQSMLCFTKHELPKGRTELMSELRKRFTT